MKNLDTRIEKSLRDVLDALESLGELPLKESLETNWAAFRARFGPDVSKSLKIPALLNIMHAHGNRDSLVYWLEFKNDDEFRSGEFGSISGRSAHKFCLFRRKETGQWVSGSNQNEKNVTEADAVIIASRHRDQVLAGVDLLEDLPAGAEDPAYLALQGALEEKAPDISGLAWAHKYWYLLFPVKLDDFLKKQLQWYNLLLKPAAAALLARIALSKGPRASSNGTANTQRSLGLHRRRACMHARLYGLDAAAREIAAPVTTLPLDESIPASGNPCATAGVIRP